jgi:uncharacterized protein (DUF58 family)
MSSATIATQPSSADAQSWHFDGVVRLTKVGTTYVLFTVVVGFAALNTGNNALYIGLTFMLGCLLLSGIASKSGLKHLAVEISGISEAWAARPSDARLRVVNRSRIWNVRDVVITSEELAQPLLLPIVERGSEVELTVQFLFAKRGRVQLRKLDLYTRYPFGFFLKKRRVRVESEVIVYPRLQSGDVARERFRPVSGEQSSANRVGPGSEIHSFRDYVRGDSLRHVAWKKSASLGRWIMKQTDLEAARVMHVVVDPYQRRGVSDDELEEMISAATTFVHHAARRGLEVILSLPRTTLRAKDANGAAAMFRALALLEPAREPVDQPLDRGTILFACGRDHEPKSA